MITIRHSPYGSSLPRAGIDTALAAAAFEQRLSVLFMESGVLCLLPEQHSREVGARDLGKLIASMPLYDIETFFVDAEAVSRFGIELDQLPPQAQLVDRQHIHELMQAADQLLSF
jgi:tRNA 2-thiouridine synthesizing protein C